MSTSLSVGQMAPEFSLPDSNGVEHRLSAQRGHWVLLYFYPRDNTPGCTQQACGIRDSFPAFTASDIVVFGISTDSMESHQKFANKYALPFTLLSDSTKEVVKLYDVWKPKKFMGREFLGVQRTSYLIQPDGSIAKIYEQVKPANHAAEVLHDRQQLS